LGAGANLRGVVARGGNGTSVGVSADPATGVVA